MDLTARIASLTLKNPLLTASGTFGYGLEFAKFGDLAALGGIVVKGLSLKPRRGNAMPRICETPAGMLNAIGIQNIGVEAFLRDKLPKLPWRATAVLANLYACSVEEFGQLARELAGAEGLAGLEVNVSCPNVAEGGAAFGQDPLLVGRITEEVRKHAGELPVIVKLSPNVADITGPARAAESAGAHALSCINTLIGMAVDLPARRPRLANVIGGLSGPAIKPVALRCVYQASRAVQIPVVGAGGIASARDVLEFMMVGAAAVQIGTANFMRPDMAFRIVEELPEVATELGLDPDDPWTGLRESFQASLG